MPLDSARCAELHNNTVRIICEATGCELENGQFQPFWAAWKAIHHELEATLHADTVSLYKLAKVPNIQPDMDAYQHFFYFCSVLAILVAEFTWDATWALNNNQGGRYIVLYPLSNLESGHRVGVLWVAMLKVARAITHVLTAWTKRDGNAMMQPNVFSYDSRSHGLP